MTLAANAPRGAPAAAAAAQGRGQAPGFIEPDGTALIAAIDWLAREAADRGSRFYQKVDTAHVAAMGMSCGGLMAYGASADPRIATVGIWNSGLLRPDEKIFAGLDSSVIIVTGGERDIASANGKRELRDDAFPRPGVLRVLSVGGSRRHVQRRQWRCVWRGRSGLAEMAIDQRHQRDRQRILRRPAMLFVCQLAVAARFAFAAMRA